MALTTVSQPHGLTHWNNGHYKHFTGTAAQILAAGLAREDQFPGANGRTKFTATYYDGKPSAKGGHQLCDEKYLSIRRVNKSKFAVIVGMSDDEKNSWFEEQEAIIAREIRDDSRNKAKARAEQKLLCLHTSKEKYKAELIEVFPALLEACLYGLQPGDYHGYSFSAKTLNELRSCIAGMCATLQRGEVVFDQQKHEALEKSIMIEMAKFESIRPALRLVGNSEPTLVNS